MSEFGRLELKGRTDEPGHSWERNWITPTSKLIGRPQQWSAVIDRIAQYQREKINFRFGTSYIPGNSGPYWHVTGDTWRILKSGRRLDTGGGCLHEEALHYFPSLAPLVQFHLHDATTGMPMHARENGAYYAQLALGIGLYTKEEDRTPEGRERWFHVFCRHVCGGLTEDDEEDIRAIFETPIEVRPPEGVIFENYADSPDGMDARRFEVQARVNRYITEREGAFLVRNGELLTQFRMKNVAPTREEIIAVRTYDTYGRQNA